MYLRSFLSDKPAAAINPSGPNKKPAKNHEEPSWPLSEAIFEAREPAIAPKTRMKKNALLEIRFF